MDVFSSSGKFQIDHKTMSRFKKTFAAFRVDDEDTQIEIAKTLSNDGVLIDPHTAIGLCAARRACDENLVASDVPIISLACAHPAKFEETVNAVTGIRPSLPSHLADLMSRQETKLYANSNEQSVKQLILSKRRN